MQLLGYIVKLYITALSFMLRATQHAIMPIKKWITDVM